MRVSGTGISSPIDIKIKPDFKPVTSLALNWVQAANGNWFATDRGASSDIYEAPVRLYGTESTIETFMTAVEDNRSAGSNVLSLSLLNATEHIFGENVDHSGTISATVITMGRKRQNTWKGFELPVRFRALSPTFPGSSGSLPFNNLEIGYEGDSDITVKKIDTYDNTFSYLDSERDIGLFEGTFLVTNANMQIFRDIIKSTRGGTQAVSAISGVTKMFGPRRGSFPHNVKFIKWEDLGMWGLHHWRIKVSMAEHV